MNRPSYQPMNKSELARNLEIPSNDRAEMRAALNRLVRKGKIVMGKKSRYSVRGSKREELVGTLRFNLKGYAWFFPDSDDPQNIEAGLDLDKYQRVYISGQDTDVAMDGDKVLVLIEQQSTPHWHKHAKHKRGNDRRNKPGSDENAAGRVLQVIERRNNVIVGTYVEQGKFKYVQPDERSLPASVELTEDTDAKSGQKVAVELESWDSPFASPIGKIVKVIGWPDDPGVDVVSVVHKHGIKMEFPSGVSEEAEAVSETIPESELERREDWRDQLVLTVDPVDAKDHDDAVLVKKTKSGWELAVHIADVSHYVKPGTLLDEEAQRRGNSAYLVDRVIPMLPEKLSNNVCSLRPDVDRLTKCAIIQFDEAGNRTSARFCDAVIRSQAKLAYEDAQEMIENDGTGGEVGDAIRLCATLARMLRKKRFAEGALDLGFAEVKIVIDDKGVPIDVKKMVSDESHQMIEECMLAANEAVAVGLKMQRKNAIHRIHEAPDFDKLYEFSEQARALGYRVGDLTNRTNIQKLLDLVTGKPNEEMLKLGLLKSLKRAAYSTEALGHYGLSKMDYCHFTSPIRRYADLVIHRGLQSLLTNPPAEPDRNPKLAEMSEVARHISETERKSAEAENESKKMKMMEYLVNIARSGDSPEFDALVTDVRRMGMFVEITDLKVKGLVKPEDMPRGDWYFENHSKRYESTDGRELGLGDRVKVEILWVDTERNQVDFRIV